MSKNNTHISVTLTNDSDIRILNKKYLSRDHPTDVLSFTYKEVQEDGSEYLGEIFVNKDQAERQAKEYGNTIEQEIAELVAHGTLHLLGVHHEDDNEHTVHGVSVKDLQ